MSGYMVCCMINNISDKNCVRSIGTIGMSMSISSIEVVIAQYCVLSTWLTYRQLKITMYTNSQGQSRFRTILAHLVWVVK
jgi:hypothetical protein